MHRVISTFSVSYFDFLMRSRVESVVILRRLSRPVFEENPSRRLSPALAAAARFIKKDGGEDGKPRGYSGA